MASRHHQKGLFPHLFKGFEVCRGYHGQARAYRCEDHEELCGLCGPKLFARFVACGGSDSFDADTNYRVGSEHQAPRAFEGSPWLSGYTMCTPRPFRAFERCQPSFKPCRTLVREIDRI